MSARQEDTDSIAENENLDSSFEWLFGSVEDSFTDEQCIAAELSTRRNRRFSKRVLVRVYVQV